MMTNDPGSADAGRVGTRGGAVGDPGAERFAAIMRYPRVAAMIGGLLVLVSLAVNLFVLKDKSGPLFVLTAASALVCVLALWNIVSYSPTAMDRLKQSAPLVEGRFSLWRAGTGGYAAVPFVYGAEHERFGVLNYVSAGLQVEVGHLASQVSARYRAPTGRRHAYAVVRLPERLPHMILSFGHLSTVLGVRIVPEQWHRSQRVDVGFGRRARLFVGNGGEQLARAFFAPELVQLFESVGRTYDIEIKGRTLYLFASRSVAAGSPRRWRRQQALLEGLVASLSGAAVWDNIRRQSAERGPGYGAEIRADVARGVAIVFGIIALVIVVLSIIAINAPAFLG